MRVENDMLGERELPSDAYYGIHTARAHDNFGVSQLSIAYHSTLVAAMAAVKQAAAEANLKLGLLKDHPANAIAMACEEIRGGRWHEQFIVDVMQGGAGTSTNMNANEVIANRALEILGYAKGRYDIIHPLDHVNLNQSTNDVYPTAVKMALLPLLEDLRSSFKLVSSAFSKKGHEFARVVKVGRTQLQDAVPMTLGQEFVALAATIEQEDARLLQCLRLLREVHLGGTAIGTGLNAHPDYAEAVCLRLSEIIEAELTLAPNMIAATQDTGVFVYVSGVVKRGAIKLSKACNDLRLLSSGPRAGFGEINLPPVQAGSSIMPGKVNPVIPELVNQVAFRVIGNDVTISCASESGQLQLNAFEPVIAHCLLESVQELSVAAGILADRCILGITANEQYLRESVRRSIGVVTALAPKLGYETCCAIAIAAHDTGESIRTVVVRTGLLTEEEVSSLLDEDSMIFPGILGQGAVSGHQSEMPDGCSDPLLLPR